MPQLQLTDTQQCQLAVEPVDRKGHPSRVDETSIVWQTSDPAVATVQGSGLTAVVIAGDPGSCQVNVTLDADLGEGVKTLTGTLDLVVVAGEATALGIKTDTPIEQAGSSEVAPA